MGRFATDPGGGLGVEVREEGGMGLHSEAAGWSCGSQGRTSGLGTLSSVSIQFGATAAGDFQASTSRPNTTSHGLAQAAAPS